MIVCGMIPLSLALILGANSVVTQALGDGFGIIAAILAAISIAGLWWLFPYAERREGRSPCSLGAPSDAVHSRNRAIPSTAWLLWIDCPQSSDVVC